ncbi:uncharacterized protein LOC143220942 [Lasioglossum baleicum]|uniref:uncharacterized protein LOC143220942 n=1 Tax=Lasioglossum baleicum TaxID=434251 RepID=UPI003FCDDF10
MKSGGRRTFRLTQVLSGHGCFGEYLNKIGREVTPGCHHCGEEVDSPDHTLETCPAWAKERRALVQCVDWDLSLRVIVPSMACSEKVWRAMASFCEQVMLQKEAAERGREEETRPLSRAGRRVRRARRRAKSPGGRGCPRPLPTLSPGDRGQPGEGPTGRGSWSRSGGVRLWSRASLKTSRRRPVRLGRPVFRASEDEDIR